MLWDVAAPLIVTLLVVAVLTAVLWGYDLLAMRRWRAHGPRREAARRTSPWTAVRDLARTIARR